MTDDDYMLLALALAEQADKHDEVPVGALIVRDDEIIGRGWNQAIGSNDPTSHAEVVAIRNAAIHVDNYRLPGATLYVTIEPCTMCVGALIHARIARLVYGATEPRTGAVESAFQLLAEDQHNHNIEVTGGVLAEECAQKMRHFFARRR